MSNANRDNLADTQKKDSRCRFDLFVRLHQDLPSNFPGSKRIFTFRGDQYPDLDTDDKMLVYLMNSIKKYWRSYYVMILCDNSYPKGDPQREIFSMKNKEIKINVLKKKYPSVFEDRVWPDWLIREKTGSNGSDEDHPR